MPETPHISGKPDKKNAEAKFKAHYARVDITKIMTHSRSVGTACALLSFCFAADNKAQGIYRNGIGARSMSMGGADVGWAEGPLSSMAINPAGLSGLSGPSVDASFLGGIVNGEFTNAANPNGAKLKDDFMFGGEGAFGMPIGDLPIAVGLSVIPDAPLSADWTYNDTDPDGGGTGVSYGNQQHKSEILVLRSALGISWKVNDKFSIGASVGLIYNDNTLTAPYIFQQTPGLAGAKTLLDLNTDGFGVDGAIGALWKPNDAWRVGVSYRSPSTVNSEGTATGDAGVQLGAPTFPFRYDAEVVNHFPQMANLGVSWQACPKWRLSAQIDWIDWSGSFDDLRVIMSNGTTVGLPAGFEDQVPLKWKDQFVYRAGAEYGVCEHVKLRVGYSYAHSPVPDSTLNPMVAAIMEHTIGGGVGWQRGRYSVDAAYQYSIPNSQSVGVSQLLSGEYNNSKVEVSAHAFAVTGGIRF